MLNLFISSIFINNILLNKFLGSEKLLKENDNYFHELILIIVMLVSNIIVYLVNKFILVPYNKEYLATIIFMLLLIIIVQLVEIVIRVTIKKSQTINPFIYVNSATFGLIFLNINAGYNLVDTIIYSIGSGLGLLLVIYIYRNISYRLKGLKIVDAFEGLPIALIVMGIMALIFSKFGV